MSVESDFFLKLLDTGDYDIVDREKITPKFFSGSYKVAFRYVQTFNTRYSKVPSKKEFAKKFPQVTLSSEAVEPLLYYIDELRNKATHNALVDAMEKAGTCLDKLDTVEAMKSVLTAISTIENDFKNTEVLKYCENAISRWEAYELRRDCGGIVGIATGIDQLDYVLGGIKDTDLTCVIAPTNVGKTWFLCILAYVLARQGYKVGFITREMGAKDLTVRIDAICAEVSYSDFRSGKLSPQDEKKYKDFLKSCDDSKSLDIVIEAVSGGISSIGAFVDRNKVDILLLDGGYLFTDEAKDSDWKGIMETFRQFKSSICMGKKIPMITNSQMPHGGKANLSNISFSKALANECDNVIALDQTEDMKAVRQLRVKPLKLRDSGNFCSYVCNWDFHTMNYSLHQVEDGKFEKPEKGTIKKMSLA